MPSSSPETLQKLLPGIYHWAYTYGTRTPPGYDPFITLEDTGERVTWIFQKDSLAKKYVNLELQNTYFYSMEPFSFITNDPVDSGKMVVVLRDTVSRQWRNYLFMSICKDSAFLNGMHHYNAYHRIELR